MNIRLRNILIAAFAFFMVIVVMRVTHWHTTIWEWAKTNKNPITFFAVCTAVGYAYWRYTQKEGIKDNMAKKCWEYAKEWWCNDMGMVDEEFKPEDTNMKEGWYDSKNGGTERMFGISTTIKGTSKRMIIVVGTQPLRVVHFNNNPRIGETLDPFVSFYKCPPKPVQGFDEPVQPTDRFGRMRQFDRDFRKDTDKGESEGWVGDTSQRQRSDAS